jgi:hypothetical protein
MKQFFLSFLFCAFCLLYNSQTGKQFSYLIVGIQVKHDDAGEKYYRIVPEEGNPNSAAINALVKHSTQLKNEGRTALYPSTTGTANIFNHFTSVSSALEYLDTQGWQLFTVTKDVYGSSGLTSTEHPITSGKHPIK